MDRLDRLGLGQDQEVVVALLVAVADPEAVAAEMRLVEAEALDLRAHGAVEDQDPLARGGGQGRRARRSGGSGRLRRPWRAPIAGSGVRGGGL